ncbi:hypothetical protein GS434_20295 [Rhodococcus hoagii]|nr:hypothetical protein [Prescottella equi]
MTLSLCSAGHSGSASWSTNCSRLLASYPKSSLRRSRSLPSRAWWAAGFGVAVVPSPRPTKETEGVRYVPLDDVGAFRPIGLAWPVGREPSPVVTRFLAFLANRGQEGA